MSSIQMITYFKITVSLFPTIWGKWEHLFKPSIVANEQNVHKLIFRNKRETIIKKEGCQIRVIKVKSRQNNIEVNIYSGQKIRPNKIVIINNIKKRERGIRVGKHDFPNECCNLSRNCVV